MLNQTTQTIQQKVNFIMNCHNINFIHKELINVYKQRGGNYDENVRDMLKTSVNLAQSPPCIRPTYRKSLRNNLAIRKLLDTPFDTGNPEIKTVEDAYVYLLRALSDRGIPVRSTLIDERDIQRIQKLMVTAVTKDVSDMDNQFDYYDESPKSRLIQECNKAYYAIANYDDEAENPLAILFELMPNVKAEWLTTHDDIYTMVKDYCQPTAHVMQKATKALYELMVQLDTNEEAIDFEHYLDHILRQIKASDDYNEIITWNTVKRLYKTLISDPS